MNKRNPNSELNWGELLKAAREGNDDALGKLFDRFRHYLLLVADQGIGKGLQQKVSASDIVQKAMLEGCRDFGSFEGSGEYEFRTWLTKLVKHNLIDSARKFRSTQRRDISRETSLDNFRGFGDCASPIKTPSSIVRRQETDKELVTALGESPSRQRQVIDLRHQQKLPFAIIAAQLETTEAAARKLWERAVQSLRKILRSNQSDEKKGSQSSG